MLRLTLLAPDILEAILNGPSDFALADLMQPIAVDWSEQRKAHFFPD